MRPLVGIAPSLDERGRWKPGRDYHYLDAAYARAVASAGGVPIYLPPQAEAETLVERVQGLLLPGGDDFPPEARYPEHVRFDPVPDAQRAFDARLLTAALGRGLPVLGICYGMQLLALQRGGRLWYDIPTDVPEAGPHRLPERDGRHRVALERGSRLARALELESDAVNSLHHQGVAEPGGGLRVAARSDDGLIEALEDPDMRFCVGVQWHPEKLAGTHRQRLFSAFVTACRG